MYFVETATRQQHGWAAPAQCDVDEKHLDWKSREGVSLRSNTFFFSAASTPKYTNYTEGFKDFLDYIFVEEGSASVEQVVQSAFVVNSIACTSQE